MKEALKILGVVTVSLIAGAYLNKCALHNTQCTFPPKETVIDTITYVDTITYYQPQPKAEVSLGSVVKFLPVFIPKESELSNNSESLELSDDSEIVPTDTVSVLLPITQREYESKDYHAWVSGYEPQLDSLLVFPRHEVVTIREPPDKPKRWGIGVFAGYGMTPRGLQPCAGVSINYNLINF